MPHGPLLLWATTRIAPLGARPTAAVRRDAGRTLALQLLAGLGHGKATIEVDPRGKPVVLGSALDVSIAHTGGLIAAAASAIGPIGIDVEARDRVRDFGQLARAGFGPAEVALVVAQGAPAFYRLWTVREAIGKATGDGLALVMDGLDRVPLAAPDDAWTIGPDGWLLAHVVVEQGISLALALRAADRAATERLRCTSLRQSQMGR